MIAQEIMSPVAVTVTPQATVREALRKLDSSGLSYLPVVHEGEYAGMVSERDIRRAVADAFERGARLVDSIEALVKPDFPTLSPEQSLLVIIDLILESHCSLLPVVDSESSELCGLVDYSDVIKAARSFFHD